MNRHGSMAGSNADDERKAHLKSDRLRKSRQVSFPNLVEGGQSNGILVVRLFRSRP